MRILFVFFLGLFASTAVYADSRLAEVQRVLNLLKLDAGPVDGAWGPRTEAALVRFLEHRGITYDGEFGDEEYTEILGQRRYQTPTARGVKICGPKQFPSPDTYVLDADNSSLFTVTLKKGDYDYVDYRGSDSVWDKHRKNLNSQRAQLSTCGNFAGRKTHTIDFDMYVTHASAGNIFSIKTADGSESVNINAFPDSIRFDGGQEMNNAAIYRGDWLNRWVSVRIVMHVDAPDKSWFRFYIDGEETFDTNGRPIDHNFANRGGYIKVGTYRGNSSQTASVSFRDIVFSKGDLGSP